MGAGSVSWGVVAAIVGSVTGTVGSVTERVGAVTGTVGSVAAVGGSVGITGASVTVVWGPVAIVVGGGMVGMDADSAGTVAVPDGEDTCWDKADPAEGGGSVIFGAQPHSPAARITMPQHRQSR